MKERRIANRLDDIFSDVRLNTIELAQITKRVFSPETSRILDHWYMAHIMARDPDIPGQEMLDFARETDYGNRLY